MDSLIEPANQLGTTHDRFVSKIYRNNLEKPMEKPTKILDFAQDFLEILDCCRFFPIFGNPPKDRTKILVK